MDTVEKTKIQLDMPCICSDEGRNDADELRAKAVEVLELTDESAYVSHLIAELWHTYGCTIEGIWMDMWYGIRAENDTEKFFVPCDRVEDGLTVLWEYHYNKTLD